MPWNAFDCRHDAGGEEHYLVLAVDESTLRNAPGFDQDSWPDLADSSINREINKYYRENRRKR